MISDPQPPRRITPELPASAASGASYIDWGVIAAGAIFALALTSLLIGFGASLGLSLASPYRGEGASAAWLAIAAGIWFVWVMVSGFGAGGYLAGRMRRHAGDATPDEVSLRDGAHGLMVWATATLVSTLIAASGVGGLVSAGASALDSATDMVSEAASSEYFANVMLRDGTQGAAPAAEGVAPAAGQQAQAGTEVDPAAQQEIVGILARSASTGEMADRDRNYLARIVAANSSLDEDGARTRVDEVTSEIDAARQTAIASVEQARVAGVVFGFIAAATLLIGAIAAFFAAIAGGKHRDDGLGFDALTARH